MITKKRLEMSDIIRIAISGTVFDGWQTEIHLDKCESNDDIILLTYNKLGEWIENLKITTGQMDLWGMKNEWKKLKLGIHTNFYDILLFDLKIIYVCDHSVQCPIE